MVEPGIIVIDGITEYPYISHNKNLKLTHDVSGLDECNGKIVGNNKYRYFITSDYPWIIGCYRGKSTL